MAGWFAKLMQKGSTQSHHAIGGAALSKSADVGSNPAARDTRYDAIVQLLRDRDVEDRHAREMQQRGYTQHLKTDAGLGLTTSSPGSPTRLYKFRTKAPCRATPEGRALLDKLRKQFSGSAVTFPQVANGQQAVMLTRSAGSEPMQIGWVEHCVQADPKLCNVRHQGLSVETDGGTMLVLRFRHPPTAVRMSSRHDAEKGTLPNGSRGIDGRASLAQAGDGLELSCGAIDEVAWVDFTELRPALDLRPADKNPPPRLVWVTRPEAETMNALGSRDYEAFYVRFKLEVLAGIWASLSTLLSSSPGSQWHQGSYYTLVREPDATLGKIYQRTLDDTGRAVDIGLDRIYDAFPATDILLLYLDGDILADFADIYFTLRSLASTDAYFLKEEFFTVIRRFWASSQSLGSRYGSYLAAVIRMSQRAVPMPAQVPLLRQDWTNLRQSLVDRYGEGGRKAADLLGQGIDRPRIGPLTWPFASFPTGEVNVGLRLVYRQEWRNLGAQRGEVIVPRTRTRSGADDLRRVDTTIERSDAPKNLDEVLDEVVKATAEAMKWPLDLEGSIDTGVRGLAAKTSMGLESECRESSRDISTRLTDIMCKMACRIRGETAAPASGEPDEDLESSSPTGIEGSADHDAGTHVYSRLQNRYEVLTRPAEIQNVVLVAEKLPTPAEIDLAWVRRHDWILAKVLLDESFRDALETIAYDPAEGQVEPDLEIDAKRDRLYEHFRANILHYQRAVWQQEDPQQRSMRYRKSGKRVSLEWRFELESTGSLTIDDLSDRLAATTVDGQFVTYSGGREADLDEVIDPAGPLGYYANYAIYRMRPEFGSEDLFSMLHFFKSGYLRQNPETGEPEVEDPMQIQLSEDPAVLAASDEVIEHHREEMVEYVPELRMELARPRSGALRRHFATYLFRRERARRIALDTCGMVIDVIRSADSLPAKPERSNAKIDLGEASDGYQLVLHSGREIQLQSANGHRDTRAEWAIVRGGAERMSSLLAGAAGGAAPAHDPDTAPRLVRHDDGDRVPRLRAGRAHDPEAERAVLASADGALRLTAGAGAESAPAHERVILAATNDERTSSLHAGRAHEAETGPRIVRRGDGERGTMLRAGRSHEPSAERLILSRDDGGLRLTAAAGGGAAHAHERVILARDAEWLRPSPVAGEA